MFQFSDMGASCKQRRKRRNQEEKHETSCYQRKEECTHASFLAEM